MSLCMVEIHSLAFAFCLNHNHRAFSCTQFAIYQNLGDMMHLMCQQYQIVS